MSYTDRKITQEEINAHHVQGATDYLLGNPQQNKAVFDDLPEFIAGKFNDLIDEIAGQHGDEIKVAVYEWLAEHPEATTTVQDNSLTTAKYVDGSVTELKIAEGAVTPSKLDRAYSTTDDLASVNANLTNELNVLDTRMDEFASLPEGSTSGDAELIDIRVGADGKTYQSAGGAVRGQVADLKSEINAFSKEGKILYPPSYLNGYIAQAGTTGSGGAHLLAIFAVDAGTIKLTCNGGNVRRYGFANTIDFTGITLNEYVNANLSLNEFTIENSNGYKYLYVYGTSNNSTYPFTASAYKVQTIFETAADALKALRGTYVTITNSNAASLGYSDAKDFENNRVFALSEITSNVISGFPEYGKFATLAVLSPLTNTTFNMYIYNIFTGSAVTSCYIGERAAGDVLWKKVSDESGGGGSDTVITPFDNTLSLDGEVIYILGDSITAGSGGTGYNPNGTTIGEIEGTTYKRNEAGNCWANSLKKYLESRFDCTVYNNGISGLSSRKLWVGVDGGVLIPNDATMVILDVGINDRGGNIDTETYIENIINYCKTRGIKIIVSTNLPLAPYVDNVIPYSTNVGYISQAGATGSGGAHQTLVFEVGKGEYDLTFSGGNIRRYGFANTIDFSGITLNDYVNGSTSVNSFSINNTNGYKYLYVYGTSNSSTTPFTATMEYDPTYAMKSWDVNQSIKKACSGTSILPVNMFSEFSKYLHDNELTVSDVTVDGIHPNDVGYDIMFTLFKQALWI